MSAREKEREKERKRKREREREKEKERRYGNKRYRLFYQQIIDTQSDR